MKSPFFGCMLCSLVTALVTILVTNHEARAAILERLKVARWRRGRDSSTNLLVNQNPSHNRRRFYSVFLRHPA